VAQGRAKPEPGQARAKPTSMAYKSRGLRPGQARARPWPTALAWPGARESQSPHRPSQSRGFRAKPGRNSPSVVRCVSFWWAWCGLFPVVSIPVLGGCVGHRLCSLTMCFGFIPLWVFRWLSSCLGSHVVGGVWYHSEVYSFYDMAMR
jgi:hypothetical protein